MEAYAKKAGQDLATLGMCFKCGKKKKKQVTSSCCHLLTVLHVIYFMLIFVSLLLTAVLFSIEFTSVFIFLCC
jgi:hypothetical protein